MSFERHNDHYEVGTLALDIAGWIAIYNAQSSDHQAVYEMQQFTRYRRCVSSATDMLLRYSVEFHVSPALSLTTDRVA